MIDTPPALRPGRLALEDGSVFHGQAFGAIGRNITQAAEVVFNTAMSGYQEALTDPSYWGQILVMTAPMIGNTGVNEDDVESVKVQVSGFVVRELSRTVSNFRATTDLASYLAKNGVLGLTGIDTRALTRRLRVAGVMQGAITDAPVAQLSDEALVRSAQNAPDMNGANLVPKVGCVNPLRWSETLGEWSPLVGGSTNKRFRVLALDCGAKRNILRNLADRNCDVEVVPHSISAADIRSRFEKGQADGLFISNGPGDPAAVEITIKNLKDVVGIAGSAGIPSRFEKGQADGLFISNGPGDPAAVEVTIKNLKDVVGVAGAASIPTFGICLGHQLLSLAVGAKTYKLKFGHRGLNQPVLNLVTGKVEITSQNHGFAVDPQSLKSVGGEVTHINLNDGTVAGFAMPDRPVFAVQHHPEASPGPHDASYLFDAFVTMMQDRKPMGLSGLRESRRVLAGAH